MSQSHIIELAKRGEVLGKKNRKAEKQKILIMPI
jgi:hypothetical protein